MVGLRLVTLLCLSAIGATGCRTRLLDPPDLAPPTPDLAGPACLAHRLEVVPLNGLKLADPRPPLVTGTLRVAAHVPLSPCDVLGPIQVKRTVGNATDLVELVASRWHTDGCPGPVGGGWTVLAIPGPQNLDVTVRDAAPQGIWSLMVQPRPLRGDPPGCTPAGPGNVCTADCQCPTGTGCIPATDTDYCAGTCNGDPECGDPAHPACDAVSNICVSTVSRGCGICAVPWSCATDACAPPPAPDHRPCRCPSDCPSGEVCDGAAGRCALPCLDTAFCPPAATCSTGQCLPAP